MNVLKKFLWVSIFLIPNMVYAAAITIPSCSVRTTPLNFGIYWGNAISTTASVSVQCNLPTTTVVQMDPGLHSANFVTRKMAAAQSTLNYNLYTTATHRFVWGDKTAGTFTRTGSRLIVYGFIPAGQVTTAGTYADTVVVTIIW